ncbi:WhiB family redox-sensing transcriptional regulator [Sphaerisporangium rubeum]|uniref:Transcriptional regulator WhiB n=2 Tax=Sphaerisporangium rubeum TaxID=321317 RepID=A0A7X0M833_9ACTN|nr:WhiB family redox-sensing transcriptional regulator [Sphaerisporangium rubeum]
MIMAFQTSVVLPAVSWLRRAACRSEDPELFFPISATGPGQRQHDQAKAVCGRCPVRAACLDYALRTHQEHGIWGGTDPDERRVAVGRRPARGGARPAASFPVPAGREHRHAG